MPGIHCIRTRETDPVEKNISKIASKLQCVFIKYAMLNTHEYIMYELTICNCINTVVGTVSHEHFVCNVVRLTLYIKNRFSNDKYLSRFHVK